MAASEVRLDPVKAPFSGVRVLDFPRALAGPYCTRLLRDAGAEVIKVEPPGGDLSRALPPVVGATISGPFAQQNSGKRSICLDFSVPSAVQVGRDLARCSDILVENFRPGVMGRLGLGHDVLLADNPALVILSISGWGQTGLFVKRPGQDVAAQCVSGIAFLNGEPSRTPVVPDIAYMDSHTGLLAFAAVSAAYFQRLRTGIGQVVDVSLLDCALQYHDTALQEALVLRTSGDNVGRGGSAHPFVVPRGVFRCSDGYVSISAYQDDHWRSLCSLDSFPVSPEDARFDSPRQRREHRELCLEYVAHWCKERQAVDIEQLLLARSIPVARVLTVPEAMALASTAGRRLTVETQVSNGGKVQQVNSAGLFSLGDGLEGGPSRLGADAEDILGCTLGRTSREIGELLLAGALDAEPEVLAGMFARHVHEPTEAS
jgi:crotonobetainyl-CoA:carnitine CoA-transferase CaiB-like acyl-CoA transferase